MDMDAVEKYVAEAVEGTRYERPTLRAAAESTLYDQLARHEEVERRLVERVHEARILMQEQFEKQVTSVHAKHQRELQQLATKLDDELRKLEQDYHAKRYELEDMSRRLIDDRA